MKDDLSELAQGINAAVERRANEQQEADQAARELRTRMEEERLQRQAANDRANALLLDKLEVFAKQIDAVRAERPDGALLLAVEDRAMELRPTDDGITFVGVGEGGDGLRRNVDGDWIITLFGNPETLLPHGLPRLLKAGLNLPPPSPLPDPKPAEVRRAPRLNTGIMPPRPPFRRE